MGALVDLRQRGPGPALLGAALGWEDPHFPPWPMVGGCPCASGGAGALWMLRLWELHSPSLCSNVARKIALNPGEGASQAAAMI